MTRQEMYRSAREQVEMRRQAAETSAAKRRAELFCAQPRLAEVCDALAAAGAAAAAAAAAAPAGAGDAAKRLSEVQRLAAERLVLLKEAGLGADALAPVYTCPQCKDTGRLNGAVCACVHQAVKRMRREEINRNSPLTLSGFENFSLERYPEAMDDGRAGTVYPRRAMAGILRDCRDWAAEFGPHSQSLYMFGHAGLGKTHLALAIARQVLEAGRDVIYISAQRAFASFGGEDGAELFECILWADLLVLDDLGSEYLNAYLRSKLYDLVNTRMGRRPTIYTSNICSQELLEQRYDEKTASRLLGDCHPMRFWGEDIRLQKS